MINPDNLKKRYYKIGEVAKIFNVATSLIRYWEGEFPQLEPLKNSSGVRRYKKEDVILFGHIYDLVKIKGYKIDGAKKALKDKKLIKQIKSAHHEESDLHKLKYEMEDIRKGLLNLRFQLQKVKLNTYRQSKSKIDQDTESE